MRQAVLLLLILPALGLAGCTCAPVLDVTHCRADDTRCMPGEGDITATWDDAHAAAWPQLARVLAGLEVGDHHHETFHGDVAAFWAHFGGDAATATELYVQNGDALHRIRVPTCYVGARLWGPGLGDERESVRRSPQSPLFP